MLICGAAFATGDRQRMAKPMFEENMTHKLSTLVDIDVLGMLSEACVPQLLRDHRLQGLSFSADVP